MRIIMACGYFEPRLGYQEVYIAKHLAALGHQLLVVASDRGHPGSGVAVHNPQQSEIDGYRVVRVASKALHGMFLGLPPISVIRSFKPEKVIQFGPGTILSDLVALASGVPVISVFGDYGPTSRSRANVGLDILKTLIKKPLYWWAAHRAEWFLATTPAALDFAGRFIPRWNTIKPKARLFPLGFDSEKFDYDEAARQRFRAKYGIDTNDVLIVSATKWRPDKTPEVLLRLLRDLTEACAVPTRLMLAGFPQRSAVLESVQRYAMELGISSRASFLPLLDHVELASFYSAADIGIWHDRPTFTILEALGTGLYTVLPDRRTVSHLLKSGTGKYFRNGDWSSLKQVVLDSVADIEDIRETRPQRARCNRWLSYRNLVNELERYLAACSKTGCVRRNRLVGS